MKQAYKFQLSIIGVLLLAGNIFAQAPTQTSDTLKMSLQQCIDYALINNYNIKNSSIDEQIANAKVGEVRSAGLPQITGQVAAQHNMALRASYFQATATNPFTGGLVAADPSTDGKIIKIPNFFQLPNALDASVTISQLLFNSSYIIGLQAARTYKDLAAKSSQITKIQTTNNVTKAYYMMLVNLERMNLFDSNILRLDSTLNYSKKMYQNGFMEKVDVMRLEVTLNNLTTEREKFVNIMVLSNVLLKYQMGMPMEKNLLLMDKLSDLKIETPPTDIKTDYNNRVEYMQLKVNKRLQELDLKNNKWAAAPSLILSANLGTFTSNTDLSFFSTNNFVRGYNAGWNTNADGNGMGIWSKYGAVNLVLQVPIFDGFGRMYKTQQSKLNVKKIENSMTSLENTIDLQTQQTAITLKNNIKTMESQKRNMELAKEVTEITQKKFKQGVASNLEMVTAESSLKEALINYYNTLYDALISKVDYDQAIGINATK